MQGMQANADALLSQIVGDAQRRPGLMLHSEPVNLLYLTPLTEIEPGKSSTDCDKWPSVSVEYCGIFNSDG
jgi:hypothetical protein